MDILKRKEAPLELKDLRIKIKPKLRSKSINKYILNKRKPKNSIKDITYLYAK